MPFHFGSWLLSPTLGWVWVPGGPAGLRQWEPARVNWVHIGNQVGWVAKNPNDREGAPANLAQGVMTRSGRSASNGSASTELITGKELGNVTPLVQPPAEFASRAAPGTPRSGVTSTIRVRGETPRLRIAMSQSSSDNRSDSRSSIAMLMIPGKILGVTAPAITGLEGARVGRKRASVTRTIGRPPVAPAALMPPSNAQNQIPRVIVASAAWAGGFSSSSCHSASGMSHGSRVTWNCPQQWPEQ